MTQEYESRVGQLEGQRALVQSAVAAPQAAIVKAAAAAMVTREVPGVKKPMASIEKAALAVEKVDIIATMVAIVASKVSGEMAQVMPKFGVVEAPTTIVDLRDTLMKAVGKPEKPSVSVTITGPLVQIMGSADRKTAEASAKLVFDKLQSIVIEPTSINAPATSKRIWIMARPI